MYIPFEAVTITPLKHNRKILSRFSLQNQMFCVCRLPAVLNDVIVLLFNWCLQLAPSICRQLQSIRKGGRVHRWKVALTGPVPNHRYISGHNTFSCEVCNPFKSYQMKLRRSGSSCFLINEPGQHFFFFFLYTSFHTTGIMGRGIFKTAACRGSAVQIF